MNSRTRTILTAASAVFEPSLAALIGSLNCNWPEHPPVLVYDLGMTDNCRTALFQARIDVRAVPAFCAHWRKYFTWRMWCLKDCPSPSYLWLDAGTCVLRPLDEAFAAIDRLGYFCSTNHGRLLENTNSAIRKALGLSDDWLAETASINAGIHGLAKAGAGLDLIDDAYKLALDEENMRPTEPLHRHDQPILTALLHKYFSPLLYADFKTYAGWESPRDVVNQKIWVHRKRMRKHDMEYFAQYVDRRGPPRIPDSLPPSPEPGWVKRLRIKVAQWRGRAPHSNRAGTVIYDGVQD